MKIFLIDDEYISNIINRKFLKKVDPLLTLIDFTNPLLAYQQMMVEQPDLLFLDLNMPGISGWEFLEKMKLDSIHIQVIIVTSSVSRLDRDRSHCYANIIGYIEKPLTLAKAAEYIKPEVTSIS